MIAGGEILFKSLIIIFIVSIGFIVIASIELYNTLGIKSLIIFYIAAVLFIESVKAIIRHNK